MKRYITLILSLGAMLVSSCHQEEIGDAPQMREVSIVATASDTKTVMQQNAVMWEDGDAIDVVFAGPSSFSVTEFTTAIEEGTAASARFSGSLAPEVSLAGGFAEQGFAVYPNGTVGPDGAVRFELPAEQTTREDGTFLSGMNLSSASVSLAESEAPRAGSSRHKSP